MENQDTWDELDAELERFRRGARVEAPKNLHTKTPEEARELARKIVREEARRGAIVILPEGGVA